MLPRNLDTLVQVYIGKGRLPGNLSLQFYKGTMQIADLERSIIEYQTSARERERGGGFLMFFFWNRI